jgi:hypothetical protein
MREPWARSLMADIRSPCGITVLGSSCRSTAWRFKAWETWCAEITEFVSGSARRGRVCKSVG